MMECPKCKNREIMKYGTIPTVKSGGRRQRYRCGKGHTFYAGAVIRRRVRKGRGRRG